MGFLLLDNTTLDFPALHALTALYFKKSDCQVFCSKKGNKKGNTKKKKGNIPISIYKFKKMNKLNIMFIVISNRVNKQNKTPLGCRITYLQRRKQFSTGLQVQKEHWNSKKQLKTIIYLVCLH